MKFKSPWVQHRGLLLSNSNQCYPRASFNPNENKSSENPYRQDMGNTLYAPNGIGYVIPRYLHGIVNKGQGDAEINEYILYSSEATELCLYKNDYYRVKNFQVQKDGKTYKMKDMIGLDKQFLNTLNGNNNFVTKEFLDLFFKNQNVTISHTVDPKFITFYPEIPNVIQEINGVSVQIPYQILVANRSIPYLAFSNETNTSSSPLYYNLVLFFYDYYDNVVQIQPLQFTNIKHESLEGFPISTLLFTKMMQSVEKPLLNQFGAYKLQVQSQEKVVYEQGLQKKGQVHFMINGQSQGSVNIGLNQDESIFTSLQNAIPTYLRTISNTGTILDQVPSSEILFFNNQFLPMNQPLDIETLKQLLAFAQKSYQGTDPNVKFAFVDANGNTIVATNF